MRTITQEDSATSSANVVSDDQEDVPIKKKKCLWDSFDELKKKKFMDLSTNEDKDEKECRYTATLITLTERRIL